MSMTTSRDDAEITDQAGKAAARTMTDEELRAQAVSFAFGNASFDNHLVTREMVERAYDNAAARAAAFELSRDRGDESDDA